MSCPAAFFPPLKPSSAAAPFARAGEEPALDDLLDDPLVHLVLARDGLERADVRARMTRAAAALRQKNGGSGRG